MMGELGSLTLEAHRARENGILPGTGGWADQALFGVRAMRVLGMERARIAEEYANAEAAFARAIEEARRLGAEGEPDGG